MGFAPTFNKEKIFNDLTKDQIHYFYSYKPVQQIGRKAKMDAYETEGKNIENEERM